MKPAVEEFVAKKFVTSRQLERVVVLIDFACSIDPIGRIYLNKDKQADEKADNVN